MVKLLTSPSRTIIADCDRDIDSITSDGCLAMTLTSHVDVSGPFLTSTLPSFDVVELQETGRSVRGFFAPRPVRLNLTSGSKCLEDGEPSRTTVSHFHDTSCNLKATFPMGDTKNSDILHRKGSDDKILCHSIKRHSGAL